MNVSPSPKRLILIVDDDQLLLDFLGEVLAIHLQNLLR